MSNSDIKRKTTNDLEWPGTKSVNSHLEIVCLSSLKPGETGEITHFSPNTYFSQEQFEAMGLLPGVEVTMQHSHPLFCITYKNTELAMDKNITKNIFIWK